MAVTLDERLSRLEAAVTFLAATGGKGPAGAPGPDGAAGPEGPSLVYPGTAFVSKAGSDVTGNGSTGRPYLTIAAALAAVAPVPMSQAEYETPASVIIVGTGTWSEDVVVLTRSSTTIEGGPGIAIDGPIFWQTLDAHRFGSALYPQLNVLGKPVPTQVDFSVVNSPFSVGAGGKGIRLHDDVADPVGVVFLTAAHLQLEDLDDESAVPLQGWTTLSHCYVSGSTTTPDMWMSNGEHNFFVGPVSIYHFDGEEGSVFGALTVVGSYGAPMVNCNVSGPVDGLLYVDNVTATSLQTATFTTGGVIVIEQQTVVVFGAATFAGDTAGFMVPGFGATGSALELKVPLPARSGAVTGVRVVVNGAVSATQQYSFVVRISGVDTLVSATVAIGGATAQYSGFSVEYDDTSDLSVRFSSAAADSPLSVVVSVFLGSR